MVQEECRGEKACDRRRDDDYNDDCDDDDNDDDDDTKKGKNSAHKSKIREIFLKIKGNLK